MIFNRRETSTVERRRTCRRGGLVMDHCETELAQCQRQSKTQDELQSAEEQIANKT